MTYPAVQLLMKVLEHGGVKSLIGILLLLAVGAFFAFVGKELAVYLKRRSEQDAQFLAHKDQREQELTSQLLESLKASLAESKTFAETQNRVNAKTIEALHDLQKAGQAQGESLAAIDDKLTETIGWIKGHAAR